MAKDSGLDKLTRLFTDRDNPSSAMGNETIAEVVEFNSSPREITLNMFGVSISKNISISQHLLSGYTRKFSFTGDLTTLDLDTIYTASETTLNGQGPHQHTFISSSANNTGNFEGTGDITWSEDSLKVGDFVKVLISEDGKTFFITDRFESWS